MAQCKIDFGECLKDSPKFRLRLEQEEAEIEHLESRLEKIIKACSAAVDSGKEYIRHQSTFATSLWDLQKHFQDSKNSTNALAQLIQLLQEMNMFHTTLLDQANRTVLKNLTSFLKRDIHEVKEYRQIFTKVSENLDAAVYKNSQVSRNRPADVQEAENVLSASKTCFNHTALDYVNYITLLQNRKRHEILGTLLSYLQACSTYFHQGTDLCEDYGTFFKNLDDEIGLMRSEYGVLDKQMQNRHTCVNEPPPDQQSEGSNELSVGGGSSSGGVGGASAGGSSNDGGRRKTGVSNYMEGYLFKRTSNAFKTWNRRWFCMRDNQLFYRKRTGEDLPTVMEEDLRLCTVRALGDSDRRYCFEVISPAKSHILQADSEAMMIAWIKALQKGIDSAIQQSAFSNNIRWMGSGYSGGGDVIPGVGRAGPSSGGSPAGAAASGGSRAVDSRVDADSRSNEQHSGRSRASDGARQGFKKINWTQMLKIAGNSRCADCGNSDPRWASINLGITLCIACSGVHRSLGVHYSKVRSLTLDAWEPEILRVMIELGNDVINRVYEGNKTRLARFDRATDNCEIAVREAWIRAKYIDRQFVVPLGGTSGTGPDDSSTSSSTLSFKSLGADSSKFPEKWSIRKLRRRSYRQLLRRPNRPSTQEPQEPRPQPLVTDLDAESEEEEREEEDEDHEDGERGAESRSRHGCPDADEKDVLKHVPKQFADILLIGDNLLTDDHNLLDEDLLLLNSDHESTSGEEDNAIMECEELERLSPNYLLYKAASGHNLPVMSQALALGADKSWANPNDDDRTPLHAAILSGSVMSCEFLLLNGASINATDRHGRTPLHLAAEQGSVAQAYLLLKHKARYDIADENGRQPIDIAVAKEDADIVTLLRLTQLNAEIGSGEDGECYLGDDATYLAIMNEFSDLASNQPQRLQRYRQQQQQQQQQAMVTTDDTSPVVTDQDSSVTGNVVEEKITSEL